MDSVTYPLLVIWLAYFLANRYKNNPHTVNPTKNPAVGFFIDRAPQKAMVPIIHARKK